MNSEAILWGSLVGLVFGAFWGWIKIKNYKRILVLKATCCRTAEYIEGDFYYIVPEKEYVEKILGVKTNEKN